MYAYLPELILHVAMFFQLRFPKLQCHNTFLLLTSEHNLDNMMLNYRRETALQGAL